MKAFNKLKRVINQDRDLKLSMIRREMLTDTIQTSIKAFSYTLSGSQALKAELCRSVLDVINHLFRISASFNSTYKPDEHFNYGKSQTGYSRARHLTIMAPGYLFMTSGLYHMLSPIISVISGSTLPTLVLNPWSLSAIAFSSLGEFYLYYKNLGDISQDANLSFYKRLQMRKNLSVSIFNRSASAGPVQDTVIVENILSITSSTIPIFTSLLSYYTGLFYFDLLGQALNGSIQMFLGYRIAQENSQILMGKSLKKEDCEKIVSIILARKEIEKVENLKNIWSIDQLRISAEIKVNKKILARCILKMIEKDMKNVEVDQEKLRELVEKFAFVTLSKSTEICKDAEEKVKEIYEFANMIDIEKGDSSESPERRKLVERSINEVLAEDIKAN